MTGKILITGAGGFVGSALTDHLAAKGHDLIPMGRVAGISPQGVRIHAAGSMHGDMDWRPLLTGLDCVIHCAGRAHKIAEKAANPLAAFRAINLDATLTLARDAAEAGVRRFIFLSSVGVNGSSSASPLCENDAPAPEGAYARSKYEAELALIELAQSVPMEVVILRPPLIYGPDAPGNFRRLYRLVISGLPLPFGLARAPKSFLALRNLTDFIELVIDHPQAANQTFLVADAETLSTREMVLLIAQGVGKKTLLLPVPLAMLRLLAATAGRGEDAARLLAPLPISTAKAAALLGWRARWPTHEAMIMAVQSSHLPGRRDMLALGES